MTDMEVHYRAHQNGSDAPNRLGLSKTATWISYLLVLLITVYAGIYVVLIFSSNISWDEFNFLAQIYALEDGRIGPSINNLHTAFYRWLISQPGSELDQILIARLAQLGFFMGAMILLYRMARQHFSTVVALTVVFLAVSYTDLLRHAFSFRFDTLLLFFSLLSLYIYTYQRDRVSALAAGAALAIGLLISIKAVFYLASILTIAIIQWALDDQPRVHAKRTLSFIVSLLLVFTSIYLIRAGMATGDVGGVGQASRTIDELQALVHTGNKMFLEEGFFPRSEYLSRTFVENSGHWLLGAVGTLTALAILVGKAEHRRLALVIMACLIPLGSVVIYRNAFPYFYVFIIPPAMLTAGLAMETALRWSHRLSSIGRNLVGVLPIAIGLFTSLMYLALEPREGLAKQRLVLQAVHELFPERVTYVDGYGMVSSFPKVGLWMSTWGMDNYHQRGEPIMKKLLRETEPKFLLANHPALRGWQEKLGGAKDSRRSLLAEDAAVLANNFVHQWGPIHVAGKRIAIKKGGSPETFEMLAGGNYTVESVEPVLIDGTPVGRGQVIELNQGCHVLEAFDPTTVTLRWGKNLPQPNVIAPRDSLWDGL